MGGFNGSGTYVRYYNWVNDKNNGVNITASRFDTEDNGYATGLSTVICKDGQTTTTAPIPFAQGVRGAAGSSAAPMVGVIGDATTGLYSSGTGLLDIASGGTAVAHFNSGGLDNTIIGAGTPKAATFTTLTATSLVGITVFNKVTITAPATGATLTIADGKTFTASNTLTLAGTDGKTITVNKSLTLDGADGKTLSVDNTLELAGTDGTKMTFPGASDTVVTLTASQTLTNKTLTAAALGSSTATTQSQADNSTKVATTAYVDTAAAAAGAMRLLSTVNASGAASVSFNSTFITSTYNKYVIEFDSMTQGTDAQTFQLLVSSDNGSNYKSTGYNWAAGWAASGSFQGTTTASASFIDLFAGNNITTSSNRVASGTIKFSKPSGTDLCQFIYDVSGNVSGGSVSLTRVVGSGNYGTAGAINNIKIQMASGTISGNFHLYGIQGT